MDRIENGPLRVLYKENGTLSASSGASQVGRVP